MEILQIQYIIFPAVRKYERPDTANFIKTGGVISFLSFRLFCKWKNILKGVL